FSRIGRRTSAGPANPSEGRTMGGSLGAPSSANAQGKKAQRPGALRRRDQRKISAAQAAHAREKVAPPSVCWPRQPPAGPAAHHGAHVATKLDGEPPQLGRLENATDLPHILRALRGRPPSAPAGGSSLPMPCDSRTGARLARFLGQSASIGEDEEDARGEPTTKP
ncbi:unnamed protein product, partial [Amoebophrya sp. A120]